MADIKEVIDMMVADGRPEEEIIALIDRYNKDSELGKPTDPVVAEPIVGSDNMVSNGEESSTGSVELGKETPSNYVDMIFSIKDSVRKDDEKVTSKAAEKYFDLSKLNRKTKMVFTSEYTTEEVFENPSEEDLRAYFGNDKYEEYIKWDNGNGELPKENKKLNSTIEVEKANRQRELVEQNINNIPKEKRAEVILALPDVIGEEKEIILDGVTYKNPQDLYNKMIKKSPEKAMRFQSDYLAAANKGFNFDFSNYETNKATFEKDNKELFTQQAELTKKFDKLGDVTEDSPQELKDQYNALVVENNNLNASLEEKGIMGLQDDLIQTRESLQARFDDLTSKAKTLSSSEMAATALGLDYSLGGRIALQMEKSFLAGGAVLGTGAMKILGELGKVKYPTEQDKKIYQAIDNNYKSAINYYEEVGEEIETTLPSTIKVEDINSGNVFQAAKQMLGNNSPSILVALGSGGVSAGLTMAGKRKAANIAAGLFFEMEAGGKIGDIEVTEKGAQANIDALNAMLIRDKKEGIVKTPDELLSIKSQISDNENALNFTGMQKAFSTSLYGLSAMYFERIGTLSYVNGLNKTSKAIGGSLMKKTIRGAKGNIFNVGVELVEETATTLAHNLTDILVLEEDKSMIEGLDADFLVNTVFTSLAIQGPSMGMNSYNVLKSEALSKQEISDNQTRTKELISIQARLKSGEKLTVKERKALVDKKRELLKEAELSDVVTVQKLARMTPQEVTDLFENNRLRRKTLKELQELGAQGDSQDEFNKKQRQDLVDKYNEYDGKREFLLGKPAARNRKMMEKLAKTLGIDMDTEVASEADMYYQLGKYQFNKDILKNIVGEKNLQVFDGLNSKDKLKQYLDQKVKDGVISQADADLALTTNPNAFTVGNDVVLMEDQIHTGITQGGAAAMFAASSPLHELLHKDLRSVGIVVDDKIVKSSNEAVASIEQHLNDLIENKLIDSVNAKRIKERIEQYRSKEGVDLEELITLVGDLKDQGVINRESMSINYDLKRLMKLVAGKFLGNKNMFLSFDTVDDVFRYIDSFQKQAKRQTLVIPPEEKKETKISFSKEASDKVQSIYEEQGAAGAFEIIEQFKPIVSKIAERRREAPNFDKELLMSEIEIGERGILDLISKYNPDSGVPLAAYINTYLPARAIEASRRVLGEEFTEDISERVDIAAEEVEVEIKAKPKKKKIVLADRLGVTEEVAKAIKKLMPKIDFNKETFKTLKDQTPEITGEMFGISPKKLISGANITKKELQSAQMFINKNAGVLISMLPEGATASGTATGVPQTLLKAFYTKTDRAKMAKTGTKAGLAIQVKNDIKKSDFLETFGIIDGKPVRTDRNTSARVLALANQTGKMITNQAVRQSLISSGKTVGEVTSLSDGKAKIMFSEGSKKKVTSPVKSASQKIADEIGKKATYDNMVKAAGIDIDTGELKLKPIDLATEEGRQEYIGFITEVLVPIFPKNVLLAMSGSFARGDSSIEKANKNKFVFQNKEQFEIFLETLEATGVVFGENMTVENQNDMLNAVKREGYGKATSKTQSKKMSDKKLKASKKRGFKLIWQTIQNNIQDDQRTIPGFALMLSSSSRFQGHFTRTGAVIDFINTLTGKNREEHTSPVTALGKYLFLHAVTGDLFTGGKNSIFENATKSYFQGSLPVFMDDRLKMKGPDGKMVYDYSSLPPIEFLEGILKGDISIWARYFHPNVNNNFTTDFDSMSAQDIANGEHLIGGVNPNVIKLENGNTIAQEFGVDVGVKITPQIAAAQQDLIYRIAIGQKISASKIKSVLNSAINLEIKPGVKQNIMFSKAVNSSRTVNPAKGITVLDFDDTLATTKSGVRANIPNTDGLPKPGRKVIFLAGGAGSGKGNVISKLGLENQGFKIVNSDISLEWLKKNSGLPENMNDFTKEQRSKLGSLQHQARGIAKRKMMKYQGEGGGVVVDGTGGSIKSMEKLVNEFKEKGYDVSMMFVETSLPVALERNAARKERSLLDKIVEKNHESVQGNKDGFKEMFGDRFMEVNTDNLSQKDAMPSKLTNKMNDFVSGYENRRLDAEEFARDGASILAQGGKFDFSEFNEVVEGQTAPLFEKAMKLQEKFGNKDMFVLTARPAESADAIHAFLTANGLNIPLKNITGLANSTAESKALWMAEKVGEGYNDFYFADDALQNVKAVQNMLDQFDVKSKVQQARADFAKGDPQVVKLLEESSMNDVKNVDRLTKPGTYDNIKFSKAHRAEYENTISKNRPDLVKGKLVSKTIDSMFDYIDRLDVPTDKRRKYEKITTKWLATSNVKLGEDSYKIQQAVELAEKHNKDIFSYNNPNEIIEAYAGKSKAKPTNPKNVKEFAEESTEYPFFKGGEVLKVYKEKYGITEHVVEETKEGMMSVRETIDTHWGPKSNPWCITARSEKPVVEPRQYGYESVATESEAQARKQQLESEGFIVEIRAHKKDYRGIYPGKSIDGKRVDMRYELDIKEVKEGPGVMEDAWENWQRYSEGPKRIVFQNGRLSSFFAGDQYWDRMDNPTDAAVIQIKKGRVTEKTELVPMNDGGVSEFVMETRTVSQDKKTVTTEYHVESGMMTDNEVMEGERLVEDRVNGVTVKETVYNPEGDIYRVTDLKGGKAVETRTFYKGKTQSINNGKNLSVEKHGDLIAHEVTDENIDYWFAQTSINGVVTEIGFKTPTGFEVMDVMRRVDGRLRVDGKKLLEVDPDVKGLPKGNIKFSKSMSQNFNDILENVTGIESDKRFSAIKGRKRGESKGKFRYFIPPSHEDFVGLLYNFMGKGKDGNKHRDFLEQALVRPLNRANREYDTARQSIANDYKELNKQFPEVKKKLTKKTKDGDFTNEDAIRVYLWNKHGHTIPGLSPTDQAKLVEIVEQDTELKAYAETLNTISKQDTYVNPTDGWNAGDIRMDLDDATGRVGREQYFAEFNENADVIFSEENLNKIEAGYGEGVRVALEDILYRIQTGRNRPSGSNKTVNRFMNFLNGSVGTVMFFNMRSALLQQMSIVNYINFADNNVFAAAKAFANQKQYWADWAFIFNSDMLKQRRGGIQTDVNGAELAASLRKSKNPSRALISKLLELGFLPTQIGDNVAIATGGASFYRNRINTYMKQGMTAKEAEAAAFTDFQDLTQSTQQSARPDMVSMQQASVLGKIILNFQNVTSQFNRLGKKAFQDIYNRRITKPNTTQMQSDISNASRITYYFAVQNLIFYTLQTAMFAMLFGDDEEDVNNLFLKKRERLINGSIDSVLRGTGVLGAVISTLKNTAIAFARQRDVNYNPDESAVIVEALNLSPVLGIKARQVVNAEKTLNYNKKVIDEMETFDIDNPQWSAVTNYVQTFTNIPLNRLYNKTQNVRQALNNEHAAWERSLMFLGWSQYNLNLENEKMDRIKESTKSKNKKKKRKERKRFRIL